MSCNATKVVSRTPLYIEHPGNAYHGHGGLKTLVGWLVMHECGCNHYEFVPQKDASEKRT